MFTLQYRRSALKDIKRLDKPVQKEMLSQINTCCERCHAGKSLKGDLKNYFSHAFTFKGVNYRIIYTIDQEANTITIEMAGSRENIYDHLKRMF